MGVNGPAVGDGLRGQGARGIEKARAHDLKL
jgi:hypothetical protein